MATTTKKRKLVKLTQGPSSSAWNFRGVIEGHEVWTSRNGKTFLKRIVDGVWFQLR